MKPAGGGAGIDARSRERVLMLGLADCSLIEVQMLQSLSLQSNMDVVKESKGVTGRLFAQLLREMNAKTVDSESDFQRASIDCSRPATVIEWIGRKRRTGRVRVGNYPTDVGRVEEQGTRQVACLIGERCGRTLL